MPRRAFTRLLLSLALAAGGPAAAQDAERVLVMATGDVTGAYFSAGAALCRVANEGRREHGLRCSAVPSEGSVDNLRRLREGSVELAITQSDVQAAALDGAGPFAEAGPFTGLRAVAALYPEPLALVTRAEAGVAGLADLPGKRVSVGAPGSGQRPSIAALLERSGLKATAFAETLELGPAEAAIALCEGRIDAFFYMVGQPALAITEATGGCGARLAAVEGPAVDALVASEGFYFRAEIPAGTYVGQTAAVPTFGVGATLVTRDDVDAASIETLAGAILADLPALAGFDRRLAGLDAAAMRERGLSAPLHPGAEAAFDAADGG